MQAKFETKVFQKFLNIVANFLNLIAFLSILFLLIKQLKRRFEKRQLKYIFILNLICFPCGYLRYRVDDVFVLVGNQGDCRYYKLFIFKHVNRRKFYKMSPNAVYKLGGELENIVRSHNYIGKHGRKRKPNEIKRHKECKATTQNAV